MSALLRSIAVLLVLAVATMAVFAVFGLMSWSDLATQAGRIVLVAAIVTGSSLLISLLLRPR